MILIMDWAGCGLMTWTSRPITEKRKTSYLSDSTSPQCKLLALVKGTVFGGGLTLKENQQRQSKPFPILEIHMIQRDWTSILR